MLLACDVGNTNLKLGVYDGSRLVAAWRLLSRRDQTADEYGLFIGGAIAPGIRTSADALLSRAARLFNVELTRPKEAVARNTVTNIQSGFVYGFAALVDGMVARIRSEMGEGLTVVATGGLAPLVADVAPSIQHVYEHLTLEGLRLAWERARP